MLSRTEQGTAQGKVPENFGTSAWEARRFSVGWLSCEIGLTRVDWARLGKNPALHATETCITASCMRYPNPRALIRDDVQNPWVHEAWDNVEAYKGNPFES